MHYALGAGSKFQVDKSSEFVDTLLRMSYHQHHHDAAVLVAVLRVLSMRDRADVRNT